MVTRMPKSLKETLTKEFKNYPSVDGLEYVSWIIGEIDLNLNAWIEVSVVRGASEGFYIHFREIEPGAPSGILFALGKAWTLEAAIKCANYFTRVIQGEDFWRYRNV
jgi:hypothetical protein